MKRISLLCVFSLVVSVCNGQDWFTSFDIAKRLALVQDKMLFVLWENTFDYPIPVLVDSDKGTVYTIDLSKDTSLDAIIWDYFVPVKLPESKYADFLDKAKGRGFEYLNKLNDDSVKIMDVNGNILNVNEASGQLMNLSTIITRYALNTSYLKSELETYLEDKNFMTAYRLAAKYVDFAIFTDEKLRPEIIALANIYLGESKKILSKTDSVTNEAYFQKIELLQIKELLILNQYNKAYRKIKRLDKEEIDTINESLFVFLKYTVFKLLKDEANADLWKNKITSLNLKKAELIIKNNMNGNSN